MATAGSSSSTIRKSGEEEEEIPMAEATTTTQVPSVAPMVVGGGGAVYHRPTSENARVREIHGKNTGLGVMFIRAGRLVYVGKVIVPKRVTIFVVFHGALVDLSEAHFVHEETIINIVAVFGGCHVIVPRGVHLRVGGCAIFGGFGEKTPLTEDPQLLGSRPTVYVRGGTVFGGVMVEIDLVKPVLTISN